MKRILFISQYLNRAGTEAFMMNVFRGIDHSRFMCDFLLYSCNETDYSREVEAAGGRVWRIPSRRESPLGWYRELNRFFCEHASEYAAIHYCGNGLTAIAPIVFAYIYKVPVRICHSHNSSSDGLHNKIFHILQRGIAKRLSTHHFACSSLAAKWFFGSSPAVIINNGIDVNKFAFNKQLRQQSRIRLGIKDTTVVIGHVGRFEAEKNHRFILNTFAEYLKIQSDACLMLVGVGSLFESIKAEVKQKGLDDKVMMLGERSDVSALMQAMDLFLMPSTFEGLPFVLIEAQCEGLPCLISDTINNDICLTSHIKSSSLNNSPRDWAVQIAAMLKGFSRNDSSEVIASKGYSIGATIEYLEAVYDGKEGK